MSVSMSMIVETGLELVKKGCYILYGAGYFTEDEWIKLDALLHKGNYVFTNGPQTSLPVVHDQLETIKRPKARNDITSTSEAVASDSLNWVPTDPSVNYTDPQACIGKIFVARKGLRALHRTSLEIIQNDSIKVTKYFRRNIFGGINQRTKKSGRFDLSSILEDTQTFNKDTGGFSMNAFDRAQTAKWEDSSDDDEDDFVHPSTTSPKNTSNTGRARSQIGSLDASRFAVLANISSQSISESEEVRSTTSSQNNEHNENVGDFQKLIHYMDSQTTRNSSSSSGNCSPKPRNNMPRKENTSERLRVKSYEIVVPKTEVCYFWAKNDSCRYTEAQCRDLHEEREYTLQTNQRNGKPNPGPLCDVVDPVPTPSPRKSHKPAKDPASTVGKRFTCYFWHATRCMNPDHQCQFLHTYVGSEGVMKRMVQDQAWKNRNREKLARPKFSVTDSTAAEWESSEVLSEAKC